MTVLIPGNKIFILKSNHLAHICETKCFIIVCMSGIYKYMCVWLCVSIYIYIYVYNPLICNFLSFKTFHISWVAFQLNHLLKISKFGLAFQESFKFDNCLQSTTSIARTAMSNISAYCDNWYTVLCRYDTVNFLANPQKILPIVRPLWLGMACLLWVHTLVIFCLDNYGDVCNVMSYWITL